jgi:cytosine/adenosine deaminase-related metal-dependent hydrolase
MNRPHTKQRENPLERALECLAEAGERALLALPKKDRGQPHDDYLAGAIAALRRAEELLERCSMEATVPPGPAAPFPRGTETDLDTLAAQACANDEGQS